MEDLNSSTPCPYTVTIRRNPHRKARNTPKYTPQNFNLREIPPFPNDDVLFAAQNMPEVPSAASIENKQENDNLRVFLRIRPLPTESPSRAPHERGKSVWPQNPMKKSSAAAAAASKTSKKKKSSDTSCILVNDSQSVTLSPPLDLQDSKRIKSETYRGFSHVFSSDSSQFEVYERMVKPMVDAFLEGESGMVAALGPSGSGKTHTVFGSPRDPGMVPLVLRHIFKETLSEAKNSPRSFYISIFEICTERGKSEKLYDLLPDGGELSMRQSAIKGLQEVLISNTEQAESLIAQAVAKRATAMTKTNSQSSRSQCIINIRDVPVMCEGVLNPKSDSVVLSIIDLAGAEREKRTGNQGTRLLESNFINNTLMVFGLCLRSLLEHQKNPKKPLQKHFQNSMLTRYMRDYLVGKKRMTLLLTAKSGVEDYLDTSHLLRQASPYMQIKYNEAEQPNMAPKKRHHQASSTMDWAKPSPIIRVEHRKKMKLDTSEDAVQNDGTTIDESNTSKKDGSTLCKLDASHPVSFDLKCDSQSQRERSHIIMRNFAKVLWSVLKEYNSKLKVAEKEIQSLKECIGYEKEKVLVLETEFNEFKAHCTCCKRGKESTKPKLVESDEEPPPTCSQLDFEKSNREVLNSLSKNQNSFEVEAVDNISSDTSCAPPSNVSRVDQGDVPELSTSFTHSDSENSELCCYDAVTVDEAASKILNESSELKIVESNGEPMLGACTRSDSKKSNTSDEIDGKPVHGFSWAQPDSEEFDRKSMDGASCTQSDSEKSDKTNDSDVKSMHGASCTLPDSDESDGKSTHGASCTLPDSDKSDGKSTHGASCTQSDSEKSDKTDDLDAKSMHGASCTLPDSDKSDGKSTHGASCTLPDSDKSDGKSTHGASCAQSDSEKSDKTNDSDAKSMHGASCTLPDSDESDGKSTHGASCTQSNSEKSDKIEESDGKPMSGAPCIQADSEKSDREVQASSSKPGHHIGLEVEDAIKKSCGSLASSSLIKDVVLDSSSPEGISSSTRDLVGDPRGEIGINNSCKPLRPKRTLMPKSSMLSRDFTFDIDESEKFKGTRKLAAIDQKISNGSITLLRLLKANNNPHL
ncbi:kinesin-like protein KIN-6 isoform X2 [Arachis stenosperma]|uniref:kinesin-like protein KIN-6 isoform X2 n=1 Tax=Arachis stenosperma TaxID=217475 RepID=UPI0025ABE3B0|nr:kinesin-like protein KIN-6 isoform X2 [Arachis stenosperma]